MNLTCRPLPLPLATPFRTAHGADEARINALVVLEDEEGRVSFGEGALPPYYPHDVEAVRRYVARLDAEALLQGPPFALESKLRRLPAGPAPARCAVDLALHDRWARRFGYPLYQLFGLDPTDAPRSSVTLSLSEDPDALREQARALRDAPVLKLKLGSGSLEQDEQAVRAVRAETEAVLGVDANGAWSVEEAAEIIPRLAGYTLAFVEEPIRERTPEAWQRLRERLSVSDGNTLPLIADESVQQPQDIAALAGPADGINVKLAKAGGIGPARRWIALAQALDLTVLLGCMVESSLAITAAACLAPLADFADLDGALMLSDDPFAGAALEDGTIRFPDRPGLGAAERG